MNVILLNQASAAQTASGNSAALATTGVEKLAVDCNVTAVSGTSPSIEPGLATDTDIGGYVRLRWAISGTSPSFTFSASVEGN